MVGVNGYSHTSTGHYIQGGITIQPIWFVKYVWFVLSSGHIYSDSRTWEVQVTVNGPNIKFVLRYEV